jgi:hypothetical protein
MFFMFRFYFLSISANNVLHHGSETLASRILEDKFCGLCLGLEGHGLGLESHDLGLDLGILALALRILALA